MLLTPPHASPACSSDGCLPGSSGFTVAQPDPVEGVGGHVFRGLVWFLPLNPLSPSWELTYSPRSRSSWVSRGYRKGCVRYSVPP